MKKLIALLLAVVTVLGLAACASEDAPTTRSETTATESGSAAQLMAGYGKVNITPTDSVPISGYSSPESRINQGLLDYLYATCVYLRDDQGTDLVLIALDLGDMYDPLPDYREQLADTFGLSEQQVMIACSNTHSGPYLPLDSMPSVAAYNALLPEYLEEVVQAARDDCKPVTGMYHTVTETSGLNFVSRYIMNDGSFCDDSFGDPASGFAGHESGGDSTLQLLKFTREGGKDVILTNFQAQPLYTGGAEEYELSADIVGVYRSELESRLDCCALYFTGASGNVSPISRIAEENVYGDHKTHAKAMADMAVRAAENFQAVQVGPIRLSKTVYTGTCDHTEDHLLQAATEVQARVDSGMSNSEALAGYEDCGIRNALHASAVIRRSQLPETMDVPLYTVSVGGFAMAFAPFELFAELGVTIKEGSPFGATFVCCCSNNAFRCMPTELAFANGGCGPCESNFVSGTGENLAALFVDELTGLYETK